MPRFRIYYKVVAITAAGYRHENRHVSRWDIIQNPETHTSTTGSWQRYKKTHLEENSSLTVLGKSDTHEDHRHSIPLKDQNPIVSQEILKRLKTCAQRLQTLVSLASRDRRGQERKTEQNLTNYVELKGS